MLRVILEGITGSGKTTLLHHMLRRMVAAGYSNIYTASQLYTSSLVWREQGAEVQDRIYSIMDNIVRSVETLDRQYAEYGATDPYRSYQSILETFHLENYIKSYYQDEELLMELDQRLYRAGYKVVMLLLPDSAIEERSVHSTRYYRNSVKWDRYLAGLGRNDREIATYFQRLQEALKQECKRTHMEVLTIETQDMDWERYADEIMEFCGGTVRS